MWLTNADLTAFYAEQGVEIATPVPGTTPQGRQGGGSGLSPEEREAFRATAEALGTPVGSGEESGQERQNVLIDAIITFLAERTGN
jgi:hypothetical protein